MVLITSCQNRTRFWKVYNYAELPTRDTRQSCESHIIAIFEIIGAHVNQTNKCIFEGVPSELNISICRARRTTIFTALESHNLVDVRPPKKYTKIWCLHIGPQNILIHAYLYNQPFKRSEILGFSSRRIVYVRSTKKLVKIDVELE